MATCGKCGYDGPFSHGCGPDSPSVSLLPRIADLEAENARLQGRGDDYKAESEVSFARAKRAEALAERRGEALKGCCSRIGDTWHRLGCEAFQRPFGECDQACVEARAAIDATPDEAHKEARP